ncbi:phage terminase large subunit family protein [Shewanella sp. KX20019]|uniref:phage terminase large subunit family protein n=1 Tax=Shewanella sp. KX20019 TaxID=2803864 RepID=UPI001928F327|nr:phage terminase large subunit family protein [Shewanella sp. KX20019]QQX80850.1 phage terminase large subunit family protein [Shewanella sp. KX20019]
MFIRKIKKARKSCLAGFAPPPDYKVSEWADAERRLSSEASAEPGRWRTSRAPYQREILDAICDPLVEGAVVMSSAQVGKTEFLLNIIGYYVDYDPAPILLLQPTVEMAQAFSKDRLAPMVRDTPAIKGKIKDARSRDSGNTVLHKSFPGGHITMAGANSPASLASRPIRILLADEVDRYPLSAGTEGDPFNLAKKRTTTFWNKKIVAVSTPTVKGASRIEALYEDSTRERYCLACPSCGELQSLKWRNIDFKTVTHCCEECGAIHSQIEWTKHEGTWIAENPGHRIRGFHLNELVSPWRKWSDIIQDFYAAKDNPELLKTFVNTSLGETWEQEGETLDHHEIMKRRECDFEILPEGVLCLVIGVDVQDDRLEYEIIGYGMGHESWGIERGVLYGDPGKRELWRDMDEVLDKRFKHSTGAVLSISAGCIDSGGHFTQMVYDYCQGKEHRRFFAVKGVGGPDRPIVSSPQQKQRGRTKRKVPLFTVGVDGTKSIVYGRLRIYEPGPGFCHFPQKYDEEYFAQLTAEKCITKFHMGFPKKVWEKTRPRNESLDIRVYALAALTLLNPNYEAIQANLVPVKNQEIKRRKRVVKSAFIG